MINSANSADILLVDLKKKEKSHEALKKNAILLRQNIPKTWRSIHKVYSLVNEGLEINIKLKYKKAKPITI